MDFKDYGTITESSKDYGVSEVLIHFEGERPTIEQINNYCRDYWGAHGLILEINDYREFRGIINPGSILVRL